MLWAGLGQYWENSSKIVETNICFALKAQGPRVLQELAFLHFRFPSLKSKVKRVQSKLGGALQNCGSLFILKNGW